MTKEKRITDLANYIREYNQQSEEVLKQLREFTKLLYQGCEQAITALSEKNAEIICKVERRKLAGDWETLNFKWRTYDISFIPVTSAAFPNPESKVVSVPLSDELTGKLVLFVDSNPVGEIYVFSNGSWCGLGICGALVEDSFAALEYFPLFLLERLTHNIKAHHHKLANSDLAILSQGLKNPIGFTIKDPEKK